VSDLPFEAIFEIRDQTSDVMDPMRAELLRLTEDLRKLVEDESDVRAIEAEAKNLVHTRIEPVVREADHRAREMAAKKWRKFYVELANTFRLAGASYFDHRLIVKAIEQGIRTTDVALDRTEQKGPGPRSTAQFVIEARTVIEK